MAAAATAGEPGTTEHLPEGSPTPRNFRTTAGSRNRKRNWLGRLLTSLPRRDGVNVVSVVTGLRVNSGLFFSLLGTGSKMSVLTSPRGKVEVVHCRRTESQDIYCIKNLIRKFTQKLFGNLNIIYLLEKANLAITLHNDQEEIMAQATFLDYPNWNIATQDDWVSVFRELDSDIPCTPLNTLFMHLFVAVDEYSVGCCKEIIRTVFRAVPDLHFVFLIVPSCMSLGLSFDRVEDHDDLMPIFLHHDTILKETYGEYFLAELIEAQDEENHAVVCEVEGVAVGFMSVCSQVNLQLLHKCFDLGPFHGLCIPHQDDILEPPQEFSIHESSGTRKGAEATVEEALSPVISENTSEVEDSEKLSQVSSMVYMGYYISHRSSLSLSLPEDTSSFRPVYRGASTAFCIQLFFIDEKYEARSLDFMNFVFHLFHDKDFCIISVPHLTPEFVLIQSFVKMVPFNNCTLDQDLYVFHRAGLLKTIKIRLATLSDTPGVEKLVSTLMPSKSILEDLKQYNEARRDPDGTPLQVFVAEVAEQVVGIAVIRNEMLSYALNHTNRKLSLEPKITINAKIVVIGASNVGISFLETLVFCHCYNDRDHELMSLCSWVNVVVGRMTAIDRAAKQVIVSREKVVLYDHLILCTGRQYQGSSQGPGDAGRGDGAQVPCPTEVDISLHPTNREVSNSCLRRYTGPIPCNHFTLNDEEDCLRALAWIKNKSITAEGNVIIYGNSIDTYTTVETLLNLGIRGSCIHLVQHPPTSIITCINDCAVEGAIEDALQAAGVTVYRDALLAQWNNGLYPDPIHTASFTTPTKPFQLPCSMFFSFLEKNVDYETFKAFNDACLVYDGRLVIDSNFHTNDIAIRAAGPLTKFSNRYYSNEWTHSNFNSKEIGFQLAAVMLKLFDPTLEPVTEPPADLDRLIPMYKGAKIKGGILPGSYHYLHVSKPAIPTPLEVQRAQSDFGSEIVTGNVKNGNYFRIHINKYKMVETITCLSKVPFPASNYIRLFGQHEQALNNLCARYEDGLVPDLY
ncbi:hypothetical protein FD754_013341, partial [Muntiacus muntjak]